jgi:hypothetical protein
VFEAEHRAVARQRGGRGRGGVAYLHERDTTRSLIISM